MKNNGVWGGLTKQRAGVRYGVEALFCLDSLPGQVLAHTMQAGLFLSHQGERKEMRKKAQEWIG